MQTAVFGIVILGDQLSVLAGIGIVVSLIGVMFMSAGRGPTTLRSLLTAWTARPALIGILSGAFFGISIVSYRAASLSLEGTPISHAGRHDAAVRDALPEPRHGAVDTGA